MATDKKVLIVDESKAIRDYHQTILSAAGFLARQAANGVEGVEWAVRETFDLVVTAIDMAKMDGYAMIRALRLETPNTTTPVIVVAMGESELDRRRAHQAGANLYLTQPADPELLQEVAALMTGTGR